MKLTIEINTDGGAFHSYFEDMDEHNTKAEIRNVLDRVSARLDKLDGVNAVEYSVLDTDGNTCCTVTWGP